MWYIRDLVKRFFYFQATILFRSEMICAIFQEGILGTFGSVVQMSCKGKFTK